MHRGSRRPGRMVPFALALCAGVALAGDARRLQIELPPDVTALLLVVFVLVTGVAEPETALAARTVTCVAIWSSLLRKASRESLIMDIVTSAIFGRSR